MRFEYKVVTLKGSDWSWSTEKKTMTFCPNSTGTAWWGATGRHHPPRLHSVRAGVSEAGEVAVRRHVTLSAPLSPSRSERG